MNWDLLDFLVFGTMLTILMAIVALARRRTRNRAYRGAVLIAVLGAFFLVWVNGAVGIIGHEGNDANLLYFGVLGVAVVGSFVARFKAQGMALVLYATAIAQVLVAAFAITVDLGAAGPIWPRDILVMTAIFSVIWVLSGWLFSRAAKHERRLFADSPFLR
ncbi:MAG: hypothetical protein QNJ11_13315 [Woeseiaceae bacterium]|nr:hypothetical protein [Woeseiaceae bacterium]